MEHPFLMRAFNLPDVHTRAIAYIEEGLRQAVAAGFEPAIRDWVGALEIEESLAMLAECAVMN